MIRNLSAEVDKTFRLTEPSRNAHRAAHARTLHFLVAGKHWRSSWIQVRLRVLPVSLKNLRLRVFWGLFHASMRAPVYVTLFVWLLSDAAAHQFTEEEMASIR